MIISWESPVEPNGIITEYNILYNDSDLQVDGNITMVTLNDLYCWKKYRVQVSASTSAGYGRESSAVGITDVYGKYFNSFEINPTCIHTIHLRDLANIFLMNKNSF